MTKFPMTLMRAARHEAIAVMALTASTHAAAHDVGTFNPDAPGNIYSLDALEVPISPVVAPAVVPFDTAIEVPLPRPRPPLRDTVGENPVVLISAFRQQHGEGPVAISGMLTRIAQEQANAMAARDLLDHDLWPRSRTGWAAAVSSEEPRISLLATLISLAP